jgi:hypothetical protein
VEDPRIAKARGGEATSFVNLSYYARASPSLFARSMWWKPRKAGCAVGLGWAHRTRDPWACEPR